MSDTRLQQRHKLYFDLSSRIALLDNARLRALLAESEAQTNVGTNQTVTIGRSKVFVKRMPVTDLEYASFFSTRNVYDLPTFYNYGLGSVGLGLYLLDEPEAPLSPVRQLSFLSLLKEMVRDQNAQLIIATHSPLIMAFPAATIYNFDGEGIRRIPYDEVEHVVVTRDFLSNPERFMRQL